MKAKFAGLVASVALLGIASAPAVAAPYTELFYTQSSGFVDPLVASGFNGSLVFNGFTGAALPTPQYPTSTHSGMSWSGITGTSSINIQTYAEDSFGVEVVGNGDAQWNEGEYFMISRLRQTNQVLTIGGGTTVPNPLWVVDVASNLRIYDDAGHAAGDLIFDDLNSTTRFSFWETLNGACPGGSPNPLGTSCDDIYTVSVASFAPVFFQSEGVNYALDFTIVPLPDSSGGFTLVCSSTSDPGCAGTGTYAPGEIKVFTRENNPGWSEIGVAMAWYVPEPSGIALLGVALLGLVGFSRGRKNNV